MKVLFLIMLGFCSIAANAQKKQIVTKLEPVVFLCDSTDTKLDLTVVDNIPYIHKPDEGPLAVINPDNIQYVQVVRFDAMYESEYKKIEKYRAKLRSEGFPAIFTKTGKGMTTK